MRYVHAELAYHHISCCSNRYFLHSFDTNDCLDYVMHIMQQAAHLLVSGDVNVHIEDQICR